MMLEVLFAHAAQTQAFLAMVVCGLVLGLLLQAGCALRGHAILRGIWDIATALCLGGMALWVLLRYAGGIRAYAVLGLMLGVLLYHAGLAGLLGWLGCRMQGVLRKCSKTPSPKEGDAVGNDEFIKKASRQGAEER